jgi:hypothetical protein
MKGRKKVEKEFAERCAVVLAGNFLMGKIIFLLEKKIAEHGPYLRSKTKGVSLR